MNFLRILFPRESLCYTCVNAFIVRGFGPFEERVFCEFCAPERRVPFAVRDCAGYVFRAETGETANPGKPEVVQVAGFVRVSGEGKTSPKGEKSGR